MELTVKLRLSASVNVVLVVTAFFAICAIHDLFQESERGLKELLYKSTYSMELGLTESSITILEYIFKMLLYVLNESFVMSLDSKDHKMRP